MPSLSLPTVLKHFWQKQPTSRKISTVFIANVLIIFTIISISYAIQYLNIQGYQNQVPDQFFQSYNRDSLGEIAAQARSFMMSISDYRMSVFTAVYNSILADKSTVSSTSIPKRQPIPTPNQSPTPTPTPTLTCNLTQPTSTIFSCQMNSYTALIVQNSWHSNILKTAKRMNIIYQNKNNMNDIMVKSISSVPDFLRIGAEDVADRIRNAREGFMQATRFYGDGYGKGDGRLSGYRVKIGFGGYWVLVQLEVFDTFFRNPTNRLLHSDNANIVILSKNTESEIGYQLINSFLPLLPNLNYTKILPLGYAESTLPSGQTIYSYTSSYPSQLKMGTVNYLELSQDENENYVIIVHSSDASYRISERVNSFIGNLHDGLNLLLGVLVVVVGSVVVTNSCYQSHKIANLFINITAAIQDYAKNPRNYFKISAEMIDLSFKDYIVRPILRNLQSVIKNIESRKKKFLKTARKKKNDQFPLNLLRENIGTAYVSYDFQRFEELKREIIRRRDFVKGNLGVQVQ